jgi:hypothetical protein
MVLKSALCLTQDFQLNHQLQTKFKTQYNIINKSKPPQLSTNPVKKGKPAQSQLLKQ